MKKTNFTLWIVLMLFTFQSFGQYDDYLGAGHTAGISVQSSNTQSDLNSTIDGSGLIAEFAEASRFLSQSTMGYNEQDVNQLIDLGFENWLNIQFNTPQSSNLQHMQDIWDELYNIYIEAGLPEEEIFGPWSVHFNYGWWQRTMTENDQLRQRVTYALSQVLVISMESDLGDYGEGLSNYYDILGKHAFGNYKDLLLDVTLNPCMGFYLSHLNNPKAIPEENIHPDENYARELMQLFTIGLYELNLDGSQKLDSDGELIPTYDNNDIKELAKVFTGLAPGGLQPYVDWASEPYFGLDLWGGDRVVPMIMFEEWHDKNEKQLVGGVTLSADQDGMSDIDQAIEHLFNHPNVGPFIGKQLIQRLIKSNPSPQYIERVASIFNDNGNGVRGNMRAVVEAIIMDEEARSCEAFSHPDNGKLREPLLRYTHFMKAIPIDSPLGRYWNNSFDYLNSVGQIALASPTVFNFYLPDYQPVGEIAERNLVAPEFNLHNTKTSISYINSVHAWAFWETPFWSWEQEWGDIPLAMDFGAFEEMLIDPEEIINYMDLLLTGGQLTDQTRQIIRDNLEGFQPFNVQHQYLRMQLITYLIMVSPDFNVAK